MKPKSREALVFQDELEIHRHPTLTRMWGPKGIQPEVPSPGVNEKKVVYGGVDYATGRITYTVAATKSGYNFMTFLVALVTAYAGRKIRLVCDNGRFHHTRAVREWLHTNKNLVEIFWLPPYCPSLNLIERLWGHLKRTVLANVLFETMNDLVAAFCRGVRRVNGRRNNLQSGSLFVVQLIHGVSIRTRNNMPIDIKGCLERSPRNILELRLHPINKYNL